MNSLDEVMNLMNENIDSINKFHIKKIGVFGSFARVEQTIDSDVDILVEFEENQETFEICKKIIMLKRISHATSPTVKLIFRLNFPSKKGTIKHKIMGGSYMNEMKQKHIWAVIGVTQDKSKFGYKIYKKLLEHNKKVYAINPNYSEIDGNKCYKNISELPEVPEVLDFVVAPKFSKIYIKEAMELGIQNYWFQPGTHNKEVLELAREKGCNVVTACVLVEF